MSSQRNQPSRINCTFHFPPSKSSIYQRKPKRFNAFTPNAQSNPKVAAKPDGGYVLTWESQGVDGNGFGVSGRYIASIGLPETSEFQINTITAGDQLYVN